MKIINIKDKLETLNITNLVVERIDNQLDEIKIKTWIEPLIIEKDRDNYKVKSESGFILDIIQKRYLSLIKDALEAEFGVVNSIQVEVLE